MQHFKVWEIYTDALTGLIPPNWSETKGIVTNKSKEQSNGLVLFQMYCVCISHHPHHGVTVYIISAPVILMQTLFTCPQLHSVPIKTATLCFGHNFCKYLLIFKILSLTRSQENCLNSYDSNFHFPLIMLLHYLVKFENSQ